MKPRTRIWLCSVLGCLVLLESAFTRDPASLVIAFTLLILALISYRTRDNPSALYGRRAAAAMALGIVIFATAVIFLNSRDETAKAVGLGVVSGGNISWEAVGIGAAIVLAFLLVLQANARRNPPDKR
jgi:phosphoglycerol transferase MdoB-like AlkP superfamily enzyme